MAILAEGQRVEQYRIVRYLGGGIAGESYEVEDTRLQRKATLKLLHTWARLPEMARRQFFREMQGISTLNHSTIAAVLDYGETNNTLYIVRRYVSPGSLLGNEGRLWFAPPLTVATAIQYTHQLAQGLHYIHNQGYVHGSLTFSNILVLRSSNPYNEADFMPFLLADIGVTNFIRRFGQPRSPFQPITAAPEQFGGYTTAASDQYALAVLLYFWLTGQLPFTGTPEEVEHLKLTETIVSPRQFHSELTIQQEGMLRRALSVYPDERYSSILAFTSALQTSLSAPQAATTTVETNLSRASSVSLPETPIPASTDEPLTQPTESLEETHNSVTEKDAEQANQIAQTPMLCIIHPALPPGTTSALNQETVTLGRSGSSDILLDLDDNVSRHHALLRREGANYFIADQRSTLGVYVNGKQLANEEEYTLQDGDKISIGEYKLIFQACNPLSKVDFVSTEA